MPGSWLNVSTPLGIQHLICAILVHVHVHVRVHVHTNVQHMVPDSKYASPDPLLLDLHVVHMYKELIVVPHLSNLHIQIQIEKICLYMCMTTHTCTCTLYISVAFQYSIAPKMIIKCTIPVRQHNHYESVLYRDSVVFDAKRQGSDLLRLSQLQTIPRSKNIFNHILIKHQSHDYKK